MNNNNPKYKAIETIHSGYRFRSRLEARWAVFFETLGIEYRYEPEGFELDDDTWYLPDFYLPRFKLWVEIKPDIPTSEEREKAIGLCIATQQVVALLAGDVWSDVKGFTFSPLVPSDPSWINKKFNSENVHWLSTSECIITELEYFMCGFDLQRKFCWSLAKWEQCSQCNTTFIVGIGTGIFCSCSDGEFETNSSDITRAFTAARQARF